MSIQGERQLGQSLFDQVKRSAIMQHALLPDSHPSSRLVRNVGTRIAEAACHSIEEGSCEHMKDLNWEFVVIDSPNVNAFVVPGGKVVVFTGIVNATLRDCLENVGLIRLLRSVDELAAVLSHEVAHIVARHSAERFTEVGMMAMVQILFALLFGIPFPEGLIAVLFALPNSRRAETEADIIGVRIMAKACYDPEASPKMLSKLDALESAPGPTIHRARVPNLLRTHPITSERIQRVRKELPLAVDLFENHDCRRKRHLLRGTYSL